MTKDTPVNGKLHHAGRVLLISTITIAVCSTVLQGCRRVTKELVSDSGNLVVTVPTADAVISSPVTVRGRARVFEAALNGRVITSSGDLLGEAHFMADAGAPEFGKFHAEILIKQCLTEDVGYVEVFAYSAKDGTIVDLVRVPVHMRHR